MNWSLNIIFEYLYDDASAAFSQCAGWEHKNIPTSPWGQLNSDYLIQSFNVSHGEGLHPNNTNLLVWTLQCKLTEWCYTENFLMATVRAMNCTNISFEKDTYFWTEATKVQALRNVH